MDRPKGSVKVVGVEASRPANPHAVYATVIVEDEAGVPWQFNAASMIFDLKPRQIG